MLGTVRLTGLAYTRGQDSRGWGAGEVGAAKAGCCQEERWTQALTGGYGGLELLAGKAHGPGGSQASGGGALCPAANSEVTQKHWSLERTLAVGGRRDTRLDHPETAGDT